eukprot:CAMPEP_0181321964 /NCGR_PEP_ID=MMETSP1101-20121128/18976_1 /TAXON_ID=46948 /ORGANISM="Rhodomonas abbreviata, Strain Caron Lab Isolate" /LENGTH=263 /DNA_ID=CAMNT_0023429847 /DNA_START=148 /DNA_END=936 /DNA_ORIENTATION=+
MKSQMSVLAILVLAGSEVMGFSHFQNLPIALNPPDQINTIRGIQPLYPIPFASTGYHGLGRGVKPQAHCRTRFGFQRTAPGLAQQHGLIMTESITPTGPHSVGEVLKHGESQWTILRAERQNSVWVYDGKDAQSNCTVQIQVLSLDGVSWNWEALDSFKRQTFLFKSARHAGVPKLLREWEEEREADFLHYRLLEIPPPPTASLATLLAQGWRPTEEELVTIAIAVLQIIQDLADARPPILHHDITPHSLLINPDLLGKGGAA